MIYISALTIKLFNYVVPCTLKDHNWGDKIIVTQTFFYSDGSVYMKWKN